MTALQGTAPMTDLAEGHLLTLASPAETPYWQSNRTT